MKLDSANNADLNNDSKTRGIWGRISTMQLLAAGAICVASSIEAAEVTSLGQFIAALNDEEDEDIILTGTDINLLGGSFTLRVDQTQFFGDGTPRTLSNGTFTVTSNSDTNYNLLNLATDIVFTGDIVLNQFARLDIDAPAFLGTGGTVTAADDADIRLFTFEGDTNTWDATFFAKITGQDDSTSFSIVGDGTSNLTALPTFNAQIIFDTYADFEFANAPLTDPTATLGAALSGNHDVIMNVGTLDLNDFDFTIDSLTGETGTSIDLGTATLTTGDTQDTTFAGVISGTGNLTKTGTGTFTLTGVNTYTGTTTVSAGTLALGADQTGPTAIIIQNGATLQVNAAQTGTPSIDVQAGGILDLNADLPDTIALMLDGTMNLNSVDQTFASIDGAGDISLGGATLTFGDATNTTLSGVISGEGNVTKTGSGELTLTGVNTYTGATTLSAGSIVVDGSIDTRNVSLAAGTMMTLNGDLSDFAAVAVGAGATLDLNDDNETLSSITGTGNITLGTGTLTVGNANASSFTFGGTISESGGLTMDGTGTFTLLNAQTYTGATAINSGTLVANGDLATSGVTVGNGATFVLESTLTNGAADVTVDAGGTIYGTGTIGNDLINNGTATFVGVGAGDTLTVNGDYTQGATGTLNVQIGAASGLVVTGTATLDGVLNVTGPADPANFDIMDTYDVLTSGGIAGGFSSVTSNFVFLDLASAPNGGNIEVSFTRNAVALADIANSPNQTTIANVLDGLGAPTDELEDVINRIVASSASQARQTYDELAGAAAGTAGTQIATNAVDQGNRVMDQIVSISPGATRPKGAFAHASGGNIFDDTQYLTLFSYAQDTAIEEEPSNPTIAGHKPKPWASIYGGFGDQGDGAEGLNYTRYGAIGGLELKSEESSARYGVSLGIEQANFDFNRNTGGVDVSSIYLSGYTRQPIGNLLDFTINGSVGYHSHESSRNILIGMTPTKAKADYDSFSYSIVGELSRTFDIVNVPADPGNHPTVTSIEPFVRLDYSVSDQDGYSETGAGGAGLSVGSRNLDSSRAAFGVRVQRQFMLLNRHESTLQGRALISTALSSSDSDLNVSFVGAPGTNFTIEGSDQDDIFGQIGSSLSVELNSKWDMHLGIDFQIAGDAFGALFAGGLSYEF